MSAKTKTPIKRRLLDYSDVAAYLNVGIGTAKALAAAGEFVKVPIGARVLFDQRDVDAYVDRIKGGL